MQGFTMQSLGGLLKQPPGPRKAFKAFEKRKSVRTENV